MGDHVVEVFVPEGGDRQQRKARARAVAAVQREQAQRWAEFNQAIRDADAALRRRGESRPWGGSHGPQTGRVYLPVKARSRHRATTDRLGNLYPWLAEAGLGAGTYIGEDVWSGSAFCFDVFDLYNRNILQGTGVAVFGALGEGKSTTVKACVTRGLQFGYKVYIPCDPKGEYSTLVRRLGGQVIELGVGTSNVLNPLDEGPHPAGLGVREWLVKVETRRLALLTSLVETAIGRPMLATEHSAMAHALKTAVLAAHCRFASAPILSDVVGFLHAPALAAAGSGIRELEADGRMIAHGLQRLTTGDLKGLFDGQSTVKFDPTLPMVSLDLHRIEGNDLLLGMVMTCASAWMESALSDPNGGKRYMVVDEAWRVMKQGPLLARLASWMKLSRHLGISVWLVMHKWRDLNVGADGSAASEAAKSLIGDCSTKIVFRQERGEYQLTGQHTGLQGPALEELPKLSPTQAVWLVGQHVFEVRTVITEGVDSEKELFNTDQRMGK